MAETRALPAPPRISGGAEIEVRNRFTSTWAAGFELVAIERDRARVRRRSDGSVLPVTVAAIDIRPRQ